MIHWAAQYIGIPWADGGKGGAEGYGCLEFVRHVVQTHYGKPIPSFPIRQFEPMTDSEQAEMRSTLHASGWRRLRDGESPQDGDVVGMRSVSGLHVGLMVAANGQLGVLHSFGFCSAKPGGGFKSNGSVRFDTFDSLRTTANMGRFQFWRHE